MQLEITREIMSSGRDVIITGTRYLCLLILIPQERKINTPLVLILIHRELNWNNFSHKPSLAYQTVRRRRRGGGWGFGGGHNSGKHAEKSTDVTFIIILRGKFQSAAPGSALFVAVLFSLLDGFKGNDERDNWATSADHFGRRIKTSPTNELTSELINSVITSS